MGRWTQQVGGAKGGGGTGIYLEPGAKYGLEIQKCMEVESQDPGRKGKIWYCIEWKVEWAEKVIDTAKPTPVGAYGSTMFEVTPGNEMFQKNLARVKSFIQAVTGLTDEQIAEHDAKKLPNGCSEFEQLIEDSMNEKNELMGLKVGAFANQIITKRKQQPFTVVAFFNVEEAATATAPTEQQAA